MRFRASVILFASLGAFALAGCSTGSPDTGSVEDAKPHVSDEYRDEQEQYYGDTSYIVPSGWQESAGSYTMAKMYERVVDGNIICRMVIGKYETSGFSDDATQDIDTFAAWIGDSYSMQIGNIIKNGEDEKGPYLIPVSAVNEKGVGISGSCKAFFSGNMVYYNMVIYSTDSYDQYANELLGCLNDFKLKTPQPLIRKSEHPVENEPVEAPEPEQQTTTTLSEGKYKIGVDAPAGEYKVTGVGTGGKGYWEVNDSSAPDAYIVGNDAFTGTSYVTVSDGQYLTLSRATAELVQ